METIRRAAPYDAELVGLLCAEAVNELKLSTAGIALLANRSGLVAKALSRPGGLARLIRNGIFEVAVGLFDEAVVGLCIGSLDASMSSGQDVAGTSLAGMANYAGSSGSARGNRGTVEGIYVTPDARGVGVGSALLGYMVSLLEHRGCAYVDVFCLPGDRNSKRLMEGAGFKARLIVMSKSRCGTAGHEQ
ncbi:MAG: GNAT family N-acetyltransferase [Acidimicrobiales bacterium]